MLREAFRASQPTVPGLALVAFRDAEADLTTRLAPAEHIRFSRRASGRKATAHSAEVNASRSMTIPDIRTEGAQALGHHIQGPVRPEPEPEFIGRACFP